ncbi:MAG: methionyl-tRNA formyltransferase, partial [Flavobacteriales bacterium]|nr:methionyl-tRNA formyltransferase [Flavobacteriales bacterium]
MHIKQMNTGQSPEKKLRIVFMGTPAFAVPMLIGLMDAGYHIVAVITAPDKPAGRGLQIQYSDVKKAALEYDIPILQPANLKDPEFIKTYQALSPDLNVVVAFRMLPEVIWRCPRLGTFNLHASLLPQYRGAAPINWAIINGETETGLTTFFIDKEIDTGKIILQEKLPVSPNETAGELHDRMMIMGAEMVLKTVKLIENQEIDLTEQSQLIDKYNIKLKSAPKISKETYRVNWSASLQSIY